MTTTKKQMEEDRNYEVAWSVFFSTGDHLHQTNLTRKEAVELARSLGGDEYEQPYARPIGGNLLNVIYTKKP